MEWINRHWCPDDTIVKSSRDDTAEAQKAKEKAQEEKRLQDEAAATQKAKEACRTKP